MKPVVRLFSMVYGEVYIRRYVELMLPSLLQPGNVPALVREHQDWADHGTEDGVPVDLVPSGDHAPPSRRPRFDGGRLDDRAHEIETTDGLVVLCGHTDDRTSWTRTGEALSALWLRAVGQGMSIVPLSQIVEVEVTRAVLQHEVLLGLAVPHLLLRVGWQPIGRDPLPPAPRRALDDVVRD